MHGWRVGAIVIVWTLCSLAPSTGEGQATCVDSTGLMCLAAIGGGVDDVFQTSDGRYAPELTFATYVRGVNSGGCSFGQTTNPRIDSAYTCSGVTASLIGNATEQCILSPPHPRTAEAANSLDWMWTQVLRTEHLGDGVACRIVNDGEPGFYVPWRGRIYDLGGEANRVVLFPITDHGPYPCEAFEYTVWLSNDPDSREIAPDGAPDPAQWNRALMIRAYNQGWTRNPNATGAGDRDRGDLAGFLRDNSGGEAVADSSVTVWALPCGITFRYASIQAGNDSNPTAACAFHSSDDELDAVAGLNEDDTAICVDADGDGHRDAACGGSDCDDGDPAVHPGAFEPCDATEDLDCQPMVECPEGTTCDPASGLCVPACFEGGCGEGFDCVGGRCVDTACAMRVDPCTDGTICRGGLCVDPCDGAVCPTGERCIGGACIDPCEGVVCPANQVCIARDPMATTLCGPSCDCDEITIPLCPADRACDARDGSPTEGMCVDPGCETLDCAAGEVCADGACADACDGVVCPLFQSCVDGACVTDLCARVSCPAGESCREGRCIAPCDEVMCGPGTFCRAGMCIPDPCAGIVCGAEERCIEGTCTPTGGIDAGADGGRDAGETDPLPTGSGGSCCSPASASGGAGGPVSALLLVLVLLFLAVRRRR